MLPESVKDWAFKEIREAMKAPVALVLVGLIGLGIGWWGASAFYAERMAIKDASIAALEKGILKPAEPQSARPSRPSVWPLVIVIVVSLASLMLALSERQSRREAAEAKVRTEVAEGNLRAESEARERVEGERDEARVALKDKKHEYAMEVLEAYSRTPFKDPQPTVTVKFASYGQDYDIAQQIKGLFTQYVKWHVDLIASNTALPRADKYKVVFDIGMTFFTYKELIHAISEGDLLGVPIGKIDWEQRDDSHNLIVTVCPSVGAAPMKAEPA